MAGYSKDAILQELKAAPDTTQMTIAKAALPWLQAAEEGNLALGTHPSLGVRVGSFLVDSLLGGLPDTARRVASGEGSVLAQSAPTMRGGSMNPLNYRMTPEGAEVASWAAPALVSRAPVAARMLRDLPGELMDAAAQTSAAGVSRLIRQKAGDFVGPADPLATFGQKHVNQAARERKVVKSATAEKVVKQGVSDGKREARPATYYRDMAATQGDDAVIQAAMAGDHLHRNPDGSYVGGPRDITSPQALRAMRNRIDDEVEIAADAINYADPQRPAGTWYPRAKAGMAETSEPWRIGRDVETHAVYSAGVAPNPSETDLAIKHGTSRAIGAPRRAKYTDQMLALDYADAMNLPVDLAAKTGEYAPKIDPRVPTRGLFGVNDFRNAQHYGYTTPEGKPWRAGATAPMHQFMDGETALQVQRLNAAAVGGKTDYTGPVTQELPWVFNKGQDLYKKNVNKYSRDRAGMMQAIRDANDTMADAIPKFSFSATHEEMPGFNTGHMQQLHNAPRGQQDAYSRAATWALDHADETALYPGMPPEVGAGPRDVLHSAAQFRTLPMQEHIGRYVGSNGPESNLSNVSTVLADLQTGEHLVQPETMQTLRAIERLRGTIDAQEMAGGHMIHTANDIPVRDQVAGVMDTGRRPLSAQEIDALNARLAALRGGLEVYPSSRGALVTNFDTAFSNPAAAVKAIKEARAAGIDIKPGRLESFAPSIQYGNGQATAAALEEFAKLPEGVSQTVARNISESPDVRKVMRAKIARDDDPTWGAAAREDVQNMRRFFSEADWAKAVVLMRKGLTPAAAVAALGYNINAMAAEQK